MITCDWSKGEWLCRCIPSDPAFRNDINMACFSKCLKCGTTREEARAEGKRPPPRGDVEIIYR